ncbi:MAG: glycosyltransferase [Polaribacter sp.]|uniref:glycosyltransferase family 4 protein n=1 Tax=Polaribacter sp. TaxID=1920175 RepID=UPI003BAFB358
MRKIILWSYNQININIVLLPAMKSQFSEFKSTKIQVVENCYTSDFENVKIDYSNKKKQILYLSNLIYSKGILFFMDFAEELLKLKEGVIVKVAGAPMADSHMTTEEVFLEFKLKSDNLKKLYPNRFFYMGVVKGKQKEELLKESSIFILPTFYKTEAFPLTIVEAMYFGNLIITTKHNYLGDVINQTNGSLVTTKSVNELIDATLLYLDNHEELKKIMISNHLEAKEKYNPKKFNDSINKIIQEA